MPRHAEPAVRRGLARAATSLGVSLLGAVVCSAAGAAWAPDRSLATDVALDRFLERHDLRDLRTLLLEHRLQWTPPAERAATLRELCNLYEAALESAQGPQRAEIRLKAETLAREQAATPGAEVPLESLRVLVLKDAYFEAESVIERSRVKAAGEHEVAEATAELRRLSTQFAEISRSAASRVRSAEGVVQSLTDPSAEQAQTARTRLADARRLRSLASYYAGWCDALRASSQSDRAAAADALVHFGVLLNALDRRPASLDRLPRSLLVHEHLARSCLGVALAQATLGADSEALRWLDVLREVEGVPAEVREQAFAQRVRLLAAGGRWADLLAEVRRARAPQGQRVTPLPTRQAAVLAIAALEADAGPSPDAASRRPEIVRIAIADLITRKETGIVVDLARRYGTGSLSSDGFLANLVRAMVAHDGARDALRALGTPDQPVANDDVQRRFREAATFFAGAIASDDAASFPLERDRAMLLRGQCLYLAGEWSAAADSLEKLDASATDDTIRRESLWTAMLALARLAQDPSAGTEASRRRLALLAVFLSRYPTSEQSARLILHAPAEASLSDDRLVEILKAVPRDAPLRVDAVTLAASLVYRASVVPGLPSEQAERMMREFLMLSDEVADRHRLLARSAGAQSRPQAAERLLRLLRQQLDAALRVRPPELDRAARLADEVAAAAEEFNLSSRELTDELVWRRVLIALEQGDQAQAERLLDSVAGSMTPGAHAARESVLLRALLRIEGGERADAARVIRLARPVLQMLDAQSRADAVAEALRDRIAGCLFECAVRDGDVQARDAALEIDRGIIGRGGRFAPVLRRHAVLSEAAGQLQPALDSWLQLVAGLDQRAPEWFEARYQSIRLASSLDREAAIRALRTFMVTHPDLGPTLWRERFRELADQLGVSAVTAPSPGGTP